MPDKLTSQDHDPQREVAGTPAGSPETVGWHDEPRIGARLGKYVLKELLGDGGMGKVYRAEDPQLDRVVAVKVMRAKFAAETDHRRRFVREARMAARLQHDHIVPIYDVGEEGEVLFIVMPVLHGQSLQERMRTPPPLSLDEILRIGYEIALGLAAAHERELIHRDIKPGNIWLEEVGSQVSGVSGPPAGSVEARPSPTTYRVKIFDFGLARPVGNDELTTQTDNESPSPVFRGTPGFASPEQVSGGLVDARTDLFSLGVVLYRLVSGKLPFHGSDCGGLVRAVQEQVPVPPAQLSADVPPALSSLIMSLLAKDPRDRPPSARLVAQELDALRKGMAERPITAGADKAIGRPGMAEPANSWVPKGKQHPAVWQAAGAPGSRSRRRLMTWGSFVLLVVAAGWTMSLMTMPRHSGKQGPQTMTGHVDVIVWAKSGQLVSRKRLSEPNALPLQFGDQIRIEAEVGPAAYIYLFWIDTEGKAEPVYPWQPGKWGTRPAEEKPVDRLSLPVDQTKGWTISGEREGMETLILLARDTTLTMSDIELQALFSGLGPQRPVQNPKSAVWFENGMIVRSDAKRAPQFFTETDVNDPVLRLQAVLREKLQPLAACTSAVSFARKEK